MVFTGLILLGVFNNSHAQSKLKVHGFLTQAFAISDGYQIFGIPKEGTFDYRTLALQFRYDIDENNSSIIQFSHRRIGNSPLMDLENDVVLDWAFFEHKATQNCGFKIGKILIPFGLYNEIRDVGILLPFYRVPYTPYSMGSYISETVNGISAYYTRNISDWDFNLDIYAGNWQWTAWFNHKNPLDKSFITIMDVSNVENGAGMRLNINSPCEGITFGSSWQRGDVSGEVFFSNNYGGIREQSYNMFNAFTDMSYKGLYLKSEVIKIFMHPGDFFMEGMSILAEINLLNELSANFSYEMINLIDIPDYESDDSDVIEDRMNSKYLRDFAIGLNYNFSSNVILKSEIHFNKSLASEDFYVSVFKDGPKDIRYFIISLATSF